MQPPLIVEADPVDHFVHRQLQRAPQAFGGALSQQSPLRLVEERMP